MGKTSFVFISCLALLSTLVLAQTSRPRPKDLLVVAVATDGNHDGYQQFVESAAYHKLEMMTVGLGHEWTGGDIEKFPGGGQKVNLLKRGLEKFKDRTDLALVVTDCYDAILHGDKDTILDRFTEFATEVVFSAEVFIWPDEDLADKYPPVRPSESPYLNSGGYMGYADKIYKLLTDHEIKDEDDDQLYFTNIFLDEYQRQLHGASEYKSGDAPAVTPAEALEKSSIKLDTRSQIFQTLNGVLDQVEVKYKMSKSSLYNHMTGSYPLVIHGNGPIKFKFNRLVSYMNDAWTPTAGCQLCERVQRTKEQMADDKLPTIYMNLMIMETTPFLQHFLERISKLTYPKNKLDVLVHNRHDYHVENVTAWAEANKDLYKSFEVLGPEAEMNQAQAKTNALKKCMNMKCEYLLSIDSVTQLTNVDSIQNLLKTNRSCVTPMMTRYGKMWSTFWGMVASNGYFAKADDYNDIATHQKVENPNYINGDDFYDIAAHQKVGVWNVPYTVGLHLIKGDKLSLLPEHPYQFGDSYPPQDYDVAFAYNARRKGLWFHVDNTAAYGHLMNPDSYDTSRAAPDIYELMENQVDWEKKYIHADYYEKVLNETSTLEEPCTDVYWFPLVTETFCDDLVNVMETYGKWSNGANDDQRLQGGYENVPTRDIHMNQVGLEDIWIQFLRVFVYPVQLKEYPGYYSTLNAIMNFVVRYRPDEQASLRPHHDASTFTINMALNNVDIDYEGGGVHFLRYNCTLTGLRKGWTLMHPGRLTHYHEGLTTTQGTRYIMVSFINP